jgi:hypothetical protein
MLRDIKVDGRESPLQILDRLPHGRGSVSHSRYTQASREICYAEVAYHVRKAARPLDPSRP